MMTQMTAIEPPPAIIAQHVAPAVKGPRARVTTTAAASLASTWETFVPIALSDVFPKAKGPVPAVRSTSGQQGRWDVVGRSRSVHLGDGSTVREEITASNPSAGGLPIGGIATFSYRVSGFSGPIGLLAKEAHGTWRFEQVSPQKTTIQWTYTFVPKSWLGSVPLRFILATFWQAYMRDGIENVRLHSERGQLTAL
jgi:Polyketide cyclase / dehydrase and lipid transport